MQETSERQKNNFLIEGLSVALGAFYNYLFHEKEIGISFLFYMILILVAGFIIAKNHQVKIRKSILILVLPLLFFSSMIFVRENESLTFFNFTICFYLLLMLLSFFVNRDLQSYTYQDYTSSILKLPFRVVSSISKTNSQLSPSFESLKKNQTFLQIARGLLFAVPLIVIFIWLFSSADMVFEKKLTDIVNFEFDLQTLYMMIKTLLVALFFIGIFGYIISANSAKKISDTKATIKKSLNLGEVEFSTILGSINILFLLFISLQLKYLFGNKNSVIAQGFTYSEYAREGFFQLILVALISFLLIRFLEKNLINRDQKYSNQFKILSSFLIIQVLVVISSAFKRLMIYEDAYGFTNLRLYSHIFTIFLGMIFVLLLYKVLINRKENVFAFNSFLSMLGILAFTNLINPDAFIVRKNIERFLSNNDLDSYYLISLSNDAIFEIIENINHLTINENGDLENFVTTSLQRKHEVLLLKKQNWQSTKLHDHKIEKMLRHYQHK
jgi:hypothetical protein